MKRKFYKKKTKVLKFFDERNLGSLPRIFISSIIVIFFFYSMPIIISFKNKDSLEFQNNSKAVLAYTLNKTKNGLSDDAILNEKDLTKWIQKIIESGVVAIDCETTSLNATEAEIVGFSMSIENSQACYIPLNHKGLKN